MHSIKFIRLLLSFQKLKMIKMGVSFIGPSDLDLIDGNFIPSQQIADKFGIKKNTLQKRVRKGVYRGIEIHGHVQKYDTETGGEDIKLLVWHGRKTICYSKMLYFLIFLTEREGRCDYKLEYNFQGRVTAAAYQKNFDHLLYRLRTEISASDALTAKSKRLLYLLKHLVDSQNVDYAILLRLFEEDEPELSKKARQTLNGIDQKIL